MIPEMKLKLIRDVETDIIAHQICCTGVLHTDRPRQGNCSRVASGWVGVLAFLRPALQVESALFRVKSKWFGLAPFPSYGCAAWRVRTFTAARNATPITMPWRCACQSSIANPWTWNRTLSFPTSLDGLGDGVNGALGTPSSNSIVPMPLSAVID